MAHYERVARGHFVSANAAVHPEVDVAAADTGVGDADDDGVGVGECGDWTVGIAGVAGGVEETGWVLRFHYELMERGIMMWAAYRVGHFYELYTCIYILEKYRISKN